MCHLQQKGGGGGGQTHREKMERGIKIPAPVGLGLLASQVNRPCSDAARRPPARVRGRARPLLKAVRGARREHFGSAASAGLLEGEASVVGRRAPSAAPTRPSGVLACPDETRTAGLAVKQVQGHSHTPSCCSAQVPKQFSDIRTAFQQMVLGEPGKNPGPSLTPNTKINSKWMTDLT